uniref:Pentatricopeptide repeat-containing protein At2g37230 n=1 Tax=Rhizophora mucronata TaxID=61149 RepID=A0A2P2LRX0_RHIMU
MGLAVMFKQPGPLNPPEKLQRVVSVARPMQNIVNQRMIKLGNKTSDRVLQPGRPFPVRHHSADYIL